MAKHNEAPDFLINDLKRQNASFPKKKFTKALKEFGLKSYIQKGKVISLKELALITSTKKKSKK